MDWPISSIESTIDLELDDDPGQLHAIKNRDGQKHRINITRKQLGNCQVVGRLRKVHYGTFKGDPAALIIFGFSFCFAGPSTSIFRYKSATIKITFRPTRTQTGLRVDPIVRRIFPGRVYGNATKEKHRTGYEILPSVATGPPLPVQVGINAKAGWEVEKEVGRRMEIRGYTGTDDKHDDDNVAWWVVEENPADADGIPCDVSCAAIVLNHGLGFEANVSLKVKTGLAVGSIDPRYWLMSGIPWSKDDPLVFEPGDVPAKLRLADLDDVDFSLLTEEQCRNLAPLPEEYQVYLHLSNLC